MNTRYILLLLIFSICALTVIGKKKKKNIDKKPTSITQELFCNACQAVVQEALKRVRESKKESDIIDALDNLCDMKHFFVYEYPPPEMRKGCEAFYAAYYDVLEKELIKRVDNDSIEDRICNKVTKVCVGVDFEAKKQETIERQKREKEEDDRKRAKQEQQEQQEKEKNKLEEVDMDLEKEEL